MLESSGWGWRPEIRREPCGYLREKAFRSEEQPVQRPWGRTRPGVLEEQRGDSCVWSRVSKGERGRRGWQGGDGAGRAGSCGPQEDLDFYWEGGGSPGGLGAERRGLTRVLTRALWWRLRGGQTVGMKGGSCGPVEGTVGSRQEVLGADQGTD